MWRLSAKSIFIRRYLSRIVVILIVTHGIEFDSFGAFFNCTAAALENPLLKRDEFTSFISKAVTTIKEFGECVITDIYGNKFIAKSVQVESQGGLLQVKILDREGKIRIIPEARISINEPLSDTDNAEKIFRTMNLEADNNDITERLRLLMIELSKLVRPQGLQKKLVDSLINRISKGQVGEYYTLLSFLNHRKKSGEARLIKTLDSVSKSPDLVDGDEWIEVKTKTHDLLNTPLKLNLRVTLQRADAQFLKYSEYLQSQLQLDAVSTRTVEVHLDEYKFEKIHLDSMVSNFIHILSELHSKGPGAHTNQVRVFYQNKELLRIRVSPVSTPGLHFKWSFPAIDTKFSGDLIKPN